MEKSYVLYVLVNIDLPVYVGTSSNIERRVIDHRYTGKEFTHHVIIESFKDKQRCLDAERCLIKYLSLFGNTENINAKYRPIQEQEVFRNLYQTRK
jgi:predicted GIY-YIG superfamily endonuclease